MTDIGANIAGYDEHVHRRYVVHATAHNIHALMARLEAAERLIDEIRVACQHYAGRYQSSEVERLLAGYDAARGVTSDA